MLKVWDVREIEYFGIENVNVGDVIINEDSSVSKVVKKTKNAIFTDVDKKPNLINRIKCCLRKNK